MKSLKILRYLKVLRFLNSNRKTHYEGKYLVKKFKIKDLDLFKIYCKPYLEIDKKCSGCIGISD